MMMTLEVLNNFRIGCSSCKLVDLNGRFVNNLYYVKNSNISKEDYLLIRINHQLFENAKQLLININTIYSCSKESARLPGFDFISYIETKKGKVYYRDRQGYFWKLFSLPRRRTLNALRGSTLGAYEWAKAFGNFLTTVDNLPFQSSDLFLCTEKNITDRWRALDRGAIASMTHKKNDPADEIDYYLRCLRCTVKLNKLLSVIGLDTEKTLMKIGA